MPTFENYATSQITKMIYIGDSGAGKTGSLASLVAAGYNVRILDLDKGVEILKDYMTNSASIYTKANPGHWTAEQCKDAIKRLSYVPISDTMTIKGANVIPKGDAWTKVGDLLNDWTDGEAKYGNITTWGVKDILVIDSLSRLSTAAFNYTLVMNGRAVSGPQQSDFGRAQTLVERILQTLFTDAIKCNVIMIAHVKFIESDSGPTKGYPQTLGKALSPQVGQYFNHALLARSTGQGAATKRVILTNTHGMVELKTSAPLRVKPEYPIETGLADYFRDIRS